MYITREDVLGLLSNYKIVRVRFTRKSDGKLREMECTTNLNVIREFSSSPATEKENIFASFAANQIRVFSIADKDWRSFLVENVVDIQGV